MSEACTYLIPASRVFLAPPALARCWVLPPGSPCLDGQHGVPRCEAADIAVDDWDMLFRAALEQMARVAQHPMSCSTALQECLDALDQLRRSVPLRCVAAALQPEPPQRI